MNYKIFIKNADGTFTDPGTNDMFRLNEPKTYNGNFHTDKNIKESDIVSSIKNNNAADIKGYLSYKFLRQNFEFILNLKNTPIIVMIVEISNDINISKYNISKTMTIKKYVDGIIIDDLKITHKFTKGIYNEGISIYNERDEYKYVFDANGHFIRNDKNITFYKIFNYKNKKICLNNNIDFMNSIGIKSDFKEFMKIEDATFMFSSLDDIDWHIKLCIAIQNELIYRTPIEAINQDISYDKNAPCFIMELVCPDVCGIYLEGKREQMKYFGDYIFKSVLDLESYNNLKLNLPNFNQFYDIKGYEFLMKEYKIISEVLHELLKNNDDVISFLKNAKVEIVQSGPAKLHLIKRH